MIRKEKGDFDDIFLQENFYYFCNVENDVGTQSLDDYEADEKFVLEWVNPADAIEANLHHDHTGNNTPWARHMMEREANVLRMLMDEEKIITTPSGKSPPPSCFYQ